MKETARSYSAGVQGQVAQILSYITKLRQAEKRKSSKEDCDPDNATCKKYIRLGLCFFVRICQHQTGNQIQPALSGELHGAKR